MRLGNKGFTLVEALVGIAVSSILIAGIMAFMTSSLVNYSISTIRGYMMSDAQLALDVINNDILLAASAEQNNHVSDTYAPGGNQFGWNANSTTLILATAAEDSSGQILFADQAQYTSHKNNSIYFLSGSTLYKRTLAASVTGNKAKTTCPTASATSACPADKKILTNVSNFQITYYNGENQSVTPDNARSVELVVNLHQRKHHRDIDVDYTTRTVFRND